MTAMPSLDIDTVPLALIAPLPGEYTIRRGDLVRIPVASWCCSFVEGRVVKLLAARGQVVVETRECVRFRVDADACTILLTASAVERN